MPKAATAKPQRAAQKPKAPKEPRAGPSSGRRGPAPGPGKQPKVFSEALGLQHLLALTHEVTAKEDAKLQSRLQRNRDSAEWAKRERVRREEERLAKKGKGPQAKRKAEEAMAAAEAATADGGAAAEIRDRRPAQVRSAPLVSRDRRSPRRASSANGAGSLARSVAPAS